MKQLLSIVVILFLCQNLNAQHFYMDAPSLKPCVFDSSIITMTLENWEIYQTDNNQWNGIRYDNCVSVTKDGYIKNLYLDNLDLSKPIFFRSLEAPKNKQELIKNSLYTVSSYGYNSNCNIDLDRNCGQSICTGIILGISVPTEDGLSDTTRYHELQFNQNFVLNACLPSEYFDNQSINEAIIKITIDSIESGLKFIRMPVTGLSIAELYEQTTFDQLVVIAGYKNDSLYELNIRDAVEDYQYSDSFLGLHDDQVYPKSGNNSYIDIDLVIEIEEKALIRILVDEYQSLSFQPYTELRSPFVSGSDSIRHTVEIVQDGAEMCYSLVEFTYGSGTNHRYKSGGISLASQDACMKFSDGAKLIVDHADMIYGDQNNSGMMAFMSGSEMHFIGKSSLIFNNTLAILSTNNRDLSYINIYLKHNQSLFFGNGSDLIVYGDAMIKVHMLGGELDISNLSKSDQKEFVLIYPEPKQDINKNIKLTPNPFNNTFNYTFISSKKQIASWSIINLAGVTILRGTNQIEKGINDFAIEDINVVAGVYIFQLITTEGMISKKVIKL